MHFSLSIRWDTKFHSFIDKYEHWKNQRNQRQPSRNFQLYKMTWYWLSLSTLLQKFILVNVQKDISFSNKTTISYILSMWKPIHYHKVYNYLRYIYLKCSKIHIKIFVSIAQKQRKNIFLYLIYRVMKQTNSETYRLNRL